MAVPERVHGSRPGEAGTRPLIVANCSGFYGDRLSAMREVLTGGPVDVITGDYLAELTLLILARQRAEDPVRGYASTFLRQLEDCLAEALERGVRLVANAGGLNPAGLARAVSALAERLGLKVSVAAVTGDDLLAGTRPDLLTGIRAPGAGPVTPYTGIPLAASAYLGCWGIVRALDGGADVVVTGRVTDASVVVGPAAWWHGWSPGDLDALAGATAAGHVLECGGQATGGNFSLLGELTDDPAVLDAVGFPLAEIDASGACVITKHPGTGGLVTVETVTEQLLYECTGSRYGGPDVVTRFDTVTLAPAGPDRVALSGARGEPAGQWLKVAVNELGGWRTSFGFWLTGLDIEAKATYLRRQVEPLLAGIAETSVTLVRSDHPDAAVQAEASALLQVTAKDPDRERVGRRLSAPLVELALCSVPGLHLAGPPASPSVYGVYLPCWVPADQVAQTVTWSDGRSEVVEPSAPGAPPAPEVPMAESPRPLRGGATRRVPLGRVAGARSGDKGGSATLGVYARTDAGFAWLREYLSTSRLTELLPETAGLEIDREELGNLRAVLFGIHGLLGSGVAAAVRFDPQAKGLGEWLRARVVEVPESVLAPVPGIRDRAPGAAGGS